MAIQQNVKIISRKKTKGIYFDFLGSNANRCSAVGRVYQLQLRCGAIVINDFGCGINTSTWV
ncbi:MAG: hypothetical protein EBQ66_07615 [Flavobacteriia bacterium]|nr:hypothetical protein [Flavobacteriia bacterium]